MRWTGSVSCSNVNLFGLGARMERDDEPDSNTEHEAVRAKNRRYEPRARGGRGHGVQNDRSSTEMRDQSSKGAPEIDARTSFENELRNRTGTQLHNQYSNQLQRQHEHGPKLSYEEPRQISRNHQPGRRRRQKKRTYQRGNHSRTDKNQGERVARCMGAAVEAQTNGRSRTTEDQKLRCREVGY